MQKRNPAVVFLLALITFGIYGIVWLVKTKNELVSKGAEIPTAWLLIIPFVSYYWLWKYSEGAEKVSGGKVGAALAFILLLLLGPIGMAVIQSDYNSLDSAPANGAPALTPTPNANMSAPIATPAQPTAVSTPAPEVTSVPVADATPVAADVTPTEETPTPPAAPVV